VKNSGFSLVEILVVLGIVVVLSGIALTANQTSKSQLSIFKTEALLIGSINRAKALSQQRLDIEDICAFGVHFSSSGFLIFGDKIVDPVADIQCRNLNGFYTGNAIYDEGYDYVVDNPIVLDSGISLNPEVQEKDIVFLPPDLTATTTFENQDGDVGLPINIVITGQSGTKTIILEEGGQISNE
jgi:prepilin-type N-terminal cleavage/methylation domain-containing protein